MSSNRSDYGTLADRTSGSRRQPLPCHVWVDGDPAVLAQWQKRPDGWWGRVVHLVDGAVIESWVKAERIRPV